MGWQERLSAASYTSPSGKVSEFLYSDISRSVDLNNSEFTFIGKSGSYVQQNGRSGKSYPMECFFTGDDCDLLANDFESTLTEKGTGILELPIYGISQVRPSGTIKRTDNLKSGYNVCSVKVEFLEHGESLGNPLVDRSEEFQQSITQVQESEIIHFEKEFGDESTGSFFSYIDKVVDEVYRILSFVPYLRSKKRQLDIIFESIKSSIDYLVGRPDILAAQTMLMIKSVSDGAQDYRASLSAYQSLIDFSVGDSLAFENRRKKERRRDLATRRLISVASLSGISIASSSAVFSNLTESISQSQSIALEFSRSEEWYESKISDVGSNDAAERESVEFMRQATLSLISDRSSSLPTRKIVTAQRPRNVLEYLHFLTGNVDGLDSFISDNRLTGSEIIEIPEGREIAYYI